MTSPFTELGLGQSIIDILQRSNITEPTPVQAEAIPHVMAGRDLIATAPTGTGKTGAFLLPALEKLSNDPQPGRGPRMLVLSPTRELAAQIGKAAKQFSEGLQRVKTVTITGGESYQQQNRVLSRPYEILIATPGRLIDQLGSDRIDLTRVEYFVLDEADRMLDIGFTDAVLEIAGKLPEKRQTLCFTATMSPEVNQLANKLLNDPHRIDVGGETHSRENITQKIIYTDHLGHKQQLLQHFLGSEEVTGQAIVFTATKRDADELAQMLTETGHPAIALHGDLTQKARTRSLNQLRAGEARVLVATDVAARGIDVSGISHVFNFDLPKFAEDYVHRIGRTGRAGASGIAISFVGRTDIGALKRIERFVGAAIEELKVPGMESQFRPDQRGSARGGRPGYGQRPSAGRGKPRGDSRSQGDRYPSRGNGDRQPRFSDDRQPKFNSDRQPRFNDDRQPRFNDDRQPKFNSDRQPRFNDDRQPKFTSDRQPRFNDDRQPRFNDDRQPNFNTDRQPRFNTDDRGNRAPSRAGGTDARGGQRKDRPAGGTRTSGSKPPRAAKPNQGGYGKPQRGGRRPKQVGLYLPETPVAKPDWRNERLSDAPKKPKVVKIERKGEGSRRGASAESSGSTWSFTGKTLRLKKVEGSDE